MMNQFNLRRLVALLLVLASAMGAWAQDEERPIWEQEVMLVYSGRSTEFNRLRSLGKDNQRLSLYTNALDTLHGKVPVKDGEKPYQIAQRMFRMIIADNDSDAIGLAAAYYNARVIQSNPYEQDIAAAKKLYWNLYEKWPERFFGQMAFVKYATLHIYDDDGSGDEVWERIQNLEPIVSDINIPELRQNVHRIMGEAYFSFELDSELAYEHMIEAYRLGIPVGSIRIEVLERIGALGEELGKNERALLAYDELVRSAPRHQRFAEFVESAERLRNLLGEAKPE
ncbi:hypothetical protein [Pelagicoccus sp. SDUM812002]|uniref:hypothetical protein n=1 Tax=Pelagicoccus sp. SDUM812002 TaxID=3041266 RepID=UPI00280E3454|nr:hypothetical protein [Pelagicoccus sp. SDUM812002]MDQ8187841.1 hypothetical protein [Pelagicoccus sp. SDUM812002]